MSEQVLITGVSGFIAKHIALNLLEKGYYVRGTLRTLARAEQVSHSMGRVLCRAFPDYCQKIPTRTLPGFVVRILARFNPTMKTVVPDIGLVALADNAYVTEMTGVEFRPAEEAVHAAGQSLIDYSVV